MSEQENFTVVSGDLPAADVEKIRSFADQDPRVAACLIGEMHRKGKGIRVLFGANAKNYNRDSIVGENSVTTSFSNQVSLSRKVNVYFLLAETTDRLMHTFEGMLGGHSGTLNPAKTSSATSV